MSSIVLTSQQRDSKKFLSKTYKKDILDPPKEISVSAPVVQDIIAINPDQSAAFGTDIEFSLPTNAGVYLGELVLETDLGDLSSGNYCYYPGLALIDQMELIHNGQTIQDFSYAPVMHSLLSRHDREYVDEILDAAGGTSHASGKVVSPIPVFWSRLANEGKYRPPFPAWLGNGGGNLVLRLKLRALADLVDSGATAGSPTISMKLYYHKVMTTSKLNEKHKSLYGDGNFNYQGMDFQTYKSAAVTTVTNTDLDVKLFRYNIAHIDVHDKLVSNWDTEHRYFINEEDITVLKVIIDGEDFYKLESGPLVKYVKLINGAEHAPANTTLGAPATIPFAITATSGGNFTGAFNGDKKSSLTLNVTHAGGDDAYIVAVSHYYMHVILRNGTFQRSR